MLYALKLNTPGAGDEPAYLCDLIIYTCLLAALRRAEEKPRASPPPSPRHGSGRLRGGGDESPPFLGNPSAQVRQEAGGRVPPPLTAGSRFRREEEGGRAPPLHQRCAAIGLKRCRALPPAAGPSGQWRGDEPLLCLPSLAASGLPSTLSPGPKKQQWWGDEPLLRLFLSLAGRSAEVRPTASPPPLSQPNSTRKP